MKIAVLNEFSQAPKNEIIVNELKKVVEPMGHQVYNAAMEKPLTDQDIPEAYTPENPRLTYLHLGIQAALLLNSGAVDFVVTGCGTGQGALMSLNMYPATVSSQPTPICSYRLTTATPCPSPTPKASAGARS